ncbi:MAG: hypothetical protein AB1421_08680 [Pseudomonadota bacterium]
MIRPLACLLLLTCLAPALAARPASNRVTFQLGTLAIDHTKSIAEITQAQAQGGFKALPGNDVGLGLYQNPVSTTLEVKVEASGPLRLTTLIKTAPVIYVAREFPKDSCAYQLILKHEWQHYLYDREVLRRMPDEVRALTVDLFDTPRPATQVELDRARQVFMQRFKHVYESLSFPLHIRIDSPAAYAELAAQCGGEIGKRLAGNPATPSP